MIKINTAEANELVVKANKVKLDKQVPTPAWTMRSIGRLNGTLEFSYGNKYDDFCGGREALLGRSRELIASSSKFTFAEKKFLKDKWGACTREYNDHYRKRLFA
jgi:hypothetical protein